MTSIKPFNLKQFLGPKTTAQSQAEQRIKIAQPKKVSGGINSQQSILRRAIRKSKKGIKF